MKEIKEGKLVQRFMTKKEIVNYGASKESKRTALRSYIILMSLLILAVVGVVTKFAWLGTASIAVFCIYLLYWQVWCMNKGKKFWYTIKENQEPIKLD